MCGYVGIYTDRDAGPSASRLKAATDLLAHRGPDDEAYYLAGLLGGLSQAQDHRVPDEVIPPDQATGEPPIRARGSSSGASPGSFTGPEIRDAIRPPGQSSDPTACI